jgi:hypothetical protein
MHLKTFFWTLCIYFADYMTFMSYSKLKIMITRVSDPCPLLIFNIVFIAVGDNAPQSNQVSRWQVMFLREPIQTNWCSIYVWCQSAHSL